jgi:hypothetical protein
MAGTAVTLSEDELELLLAALDSHRYWELCDPVYGQGEGAGAEAERAIAALDALERRLVTAREATEPPAG